LKGYLTTTLQIVTLVTQKYIELLLQHQETAF